MAFNWKEAVKGFAMSKDQYSKYQDTKRDQQKTQDNREFEIMKMLYQDKLASDRAVRLEETRGRRNMGGYKDPNEIPVKGVGGMPLAGYHQSPSGNYLPKYAHASRDLEMAEGFQKFNEEANKPIVMTGPDGKRYQIPRENAEKAKQRGFR